MTLPFSDEKSAASVVGAILPELRAVPSKRTRVKISRRGREIDLEVTSDDTTSMRAAVNSYLRWFILAKGLTEMMGDDS